MGRPRKNPVGKEVIKGLVKLTRPVEWQKTFFYMLLGSVIALRGIPDVRFLLGFLAVGPLLWGGLYALNDYTDREDDAQHPVKRKRPIPSGQVPSSLALLFSLLLISSGLLLSWHLGIFIPALAMLINQLLYTLRPFRLKERPGLDIVSGSMVNPAMRFLSGYLLYSSSLSFVPFLLTLVFTQAFGYTFYRYTSREHEKKLGYRSTVVVLGEKTKYLALLFGLSALISYVYSCLFGPLDLRFLSLFVVFLPVVPLYYRMYKRGLEPLYRFFYLNLSLIILYFLLLFSLPTA